MYIPELVLSHYFFDKSSEDFIKKAFSDSIGENRENEAIALRQTKVDLYIA